MHVLMFDRQCRETQSGAWFDVCTLHGSGEKATAEQTEAGSVCRINGSNAVPTSTMTPIYNDRLPAPL